MQIYVYDTQVSIRSIDLSFQYETLIIWKFDLSEGIWEIFDSHRIIFWKLNSESLPTSHVWE